MWQRFVPLLLLLASAPAWAQTPQPAEGAPARRVVNAAPLAGVVRVDGRLDEPAWTGAEAATAFTQAYPNAGAPASQRTEVRVVVGTDALYVGARMFDSNPDSIAAQLSRRDASDTYSDRIVLYLDSQNDRRTAFQFGVNPRGVKQDGYHFEDRQEDPSWDAVWDVATVVDSLGWTAEFRIPLSQLRFSDRVEGGRVWGVGFMRDVARNEERDTWSPWTRNSPGFVSALGELRGLDAVRAPQRLEVLPYTSTRLERAPGDRDNPFYRSNDFGMSMGADVRYGLPRGLTLTATINPDFGQVEVDPAVVNLGAFETFFPERRPFFVEGMDIFRYGKVTAYNGYGVDEAFYTRRIGRTPQGRVGGDAVYVDAPDQSTILAAAKVSGRTAGGWSVGIMDAVTAREEARFLNGEGAESTRAVEPRSNYFIGRVRRDLNRGSTLLGGIVTATHREGADGVFDGFLRSSAYVAGTDWEHSWKQRTWTLSGFLTGTRAEGSRAAIGVAQRTSARYFQRPDADYLKYDSTATALNGYMASAALARNGAWHGSLVYEGASPGFEINDLGFQPRVDYHALTSLVGHRVNRPGKVFRNYALGAYGGGAWNFGGDRVFNALGLTGSGTFNNLWRGSVMLRHDPARIDDRLTFGGPAAGSPSSTTLSGSLSSDPRRKLSGRANLAYAEDRSGARERSLGLSFSLRPTPWLNVSMGPALTRGFYTTQFIQTVSDPLATATFGRRYVFASTDVTEFAMSTRVNWTFTPDLSLQLFAQPFVSSAAFSDYKEFRTPRARDFDVYGRDMGTIETGAACGSRAGEAGIPTVDPDGGGPAPCFQIRSFYDRDFTVRSLRGNAVLRWEYRPGSTLFAVWQQVRDGEHSFGDVAFGRDARGIFEESARNVFMIKATYWVGR